MNFSFLQKRHLNTPSNKIPDTNNVTTIYSLAKLLAGEQVYMDLLTEVWHEFGQSKELLKEIELRQDLIEVNLMYLKSGDRSLKNDIKIVQAELDKLLKESGDTVEYDFDKEVGGLAKHLGCGPINQKKMSMFDYYAATRI